MRLRIRAGICAMLLVVLACSSAQAGAVGLSGFLEGPISAFPPESNGAPIPERLAADQHISVAQAERDLELQTLAGNIAGDLAARLGGNFAGIWFDNQTGTFHIGIAPTTSRASAEAVAADHGVASHSDLQSVAHTWGEVQAAASRLQDRIAASIGSTPFAVVASASANTPIVELATTAPQSDVATVNASVAASPVPAHVVRVGRPLLMAEPTAECAWPYCNKPIRGGVRINGGNYICTEGPMERDANGYPYILTAGHCTEDFGGTWWTKPATPANACNIGNPVAGAVAQHIDAVVISAPGACGTMASGIVEWRTQYEYYKVHGVVGAYAGLYECHPGAASVNECGTVEAVNTSAVIAYKKGAILVEHLDRLCATAIGGDSGGPVQYGNSEWTYLTAITTASNNTWGGCSAGARMWAYELPYAEAFIGVHTITE